MQIASGGGSRHLRYRADEAAEDGVKDIYQVVTRADAALEQSRTAATKDSCGSRAARPASAGINSMKIMPQLRASP